MRKICKRVMKNFEYLIVALVWFTNIFESCGVAVRRKDDFGLRFRGTFHQWLTSYVSYREQFVAHRQTKSPLQPVVTGVLQGSTLGLVLSLLMLIGYYFSHWTERYLLQMIPLRSTLKKLNKIWLLNATSIYKRWMTGSDSTKFAPIWKKKRKQ